MDCVCMCNRRGSDRLIMNSTLGTSCEGRGMSGALGAVNIQSFDFLLNPQYIPFGREWNALGDLF